MTKTIAIYDADEDYVKGLADFFRKRNIGFFVEPFTDYDSFQRFCDEKQVDLAVTQEKCFVKGIPCMALVAEKEAKDYPAVYKYQPLDSIVREILCYYSELHQGEALLDKAQRGTITGVFSPVKRCGKTMFALALGQLLAAEKKTLYVNFELYGSFEEMTGQEYHRNLSDLIYYIKEDKGQWQTYMQSMIYQMGKLDYIPPSGYAEHMLELSKEEWENCIRKLCTSGLYEQYVLDIEENIRGHPALLGLCNKIYMPVLDDPVSKAKQNSFFENLEKMELSNLKEKIEIVHMPFMTGMSLPEWSEQLIYSPVGEAASNVLHKGEYYE